MKKFFSLLIVMVCACLQMSAQFIPVEGKQYLIQDTKNTSLYVVLATGSDSAGGASNATYASLSAEGTPFYITEDGDGFVFSTEDGKYLSNTHAWNITTSDASVWYINEVGDGSYYIYKDASKGLGADSHAAGKGLYNDKTGQAWNIVEYVAPEVKHEVIAEVDGEQSKMLADGEGGYEVTVTLGVGEHSVVVYYDGAEVYNSTFTTTSFVVNGETLTEGKVSIAYVPETNKVTITGDGVAAQTSSWDGTWVISPSFDTVPESWDALVGNLTLTFPGATTVAPGADAFVQLIDEYGDNNYWMCAPGYVSAYEDYGVTDLGSIVAQGNTLKFNGVVPELLGAVPYESGKVCGYLGGTYIVDGEEVTLEDEVMYLSWEMPEVTPSEGWTGEFVFNPADGDVLESASDVEHITITFPGAKEVQLNYVQGMIYNEMGNAYHYVCFSNYGGAYGTASAEGNVVTLNFVNGVAGCIPYESGILHGYFQGSFVVDGETVGMNGIEAYYSVGNSAPEKGVYIVGIDGNWDPSNPSLTVTPTELGEYIFNYTTTEDRWFAIGTVLGADANDWDTFNANRLGAPSADYRLSKGDVVDLTLGLNNSFFIPAGEWQFEIDLENSKLYVYKGAEPYVWEPAEMEIVGSFNNWGNDGVEDQYKAADGNGTWTINCQLPAGTHEFKVRADGAWDHNWGGELAAQYSQGTAYKNGANFSLTLDKASDVTIYLYQVSEDQLNYVWYAEEVIVPFSAEEGQAYNIMYTDGTGIDFETLSSGTDGCTTLVTSTATPSKVYFTAVDGGWTIKSGDKYLAAYKNLTGSLKWSTGLSDEPYVWTIDGTAEDFTLTREDGKNVKVEGGKLYCDNTNSSVTAHFYLVPAKTVWNGEIAAAMTDELTCEVEFCEADQVDVTNFGVLGGIFDEGGDVVALAVADAENVLNVAGSVEVKGRKALVHFEKIADLKAKGVDVAAAAKKIGGFATTGKATAYICPKSFKVDGEMVYDAITADYDYATGTTTGINAIESTTAATIFDLQGRRVRNANNGVFIYNGKKVVK